MGATILAVAFAHPTERVNVQMDKEFVTAYLNATTHYGDPKAGCESDEVAIQIQGVTGDFCSPKCSILAACPSDLPEGVTAKPQCALSSSTGGKYCALICTPSSNDD